MFQVFKGIGKYTGVLQDSAEGFGDVSSLDDEDVSEGAKVKPLPGVWFPLIDAVSFLWPMAGDNPGRKTPPAHPCVASGEQGRP